MGAGMMPIPLPKDASSKQPTRTVNTEQVLRKPVKRMGVPIKAAVLACKRIKLEHLLAPPVPAELPISHPSPSAGTPPQSSTQDSSHEDAAKTPFIPPLTDGEFPIVIRADQCIHWNGRSGKSLCDLWRCGIHAAPAPTAVFLRYFPANWETLNFCKTCRGKSRRAQSACAIKAVF